jgi:hypothetical protein
MQDLGKIAILVLLAMFIYGCHKRRMAIELGEDKPCPVTLVQGQRPPEYPALTAYANAQGLAAKGDCWQERVYDYSVSHGPALPAKAAKEFRELRVK